jgi:hypothetical protein
VIRRGMEPRRRSARIAHAMPHTEARVVAVSGTLLPGLAERSIARPAIRAVVVGELADAYPLAERAIAARVAREGCALTSVRLVLYDAAALRLELFAELRLHPPRRGHGACSGRRHVTSHRWSV